MSTSTEEMPPEAVQEPLRKGFSVNESRTGGPVFRWGEGQRLHIPWILYGHLIGVDESRHLEIHFRNNFQVHVDYGEEFEVDALLEAIDGCCLEELAHSSSVCEVSVYRVNKDELERI